MHLGWWRAISQSVRLPADGFLRKKEKRPQRRRIAAMRIVCYFGSIRWSWRVAMDTASRPFSSSISLCLSHIEISVSAGGFLSISSPSLPPSAMKLSPPRSSFGGRAAERVPMTSFATNSWDGDERRGLGRGRRLGVFGRGRLFCGLTQRGARQVSAREGVSDGWLFAAGGNAISCTCSVFVLRAMV